MEILREVSKNTWKVYFIILTMLFIIFSLVLPVDVYSFITIPYIFIGPVLFFVLFWKMGFDFSDYVGKKYPELMKKHSVQWGVMKGETLNVLSVFLNRKEFESYNDSILKGYFEKRLLLMKLTLFSFIIAPTISIIIMNLRT